jgi:hypothetical protein
MDIRVLLPYVLVAFGLGFLVANLLVTVDLVRFLKRRRKAVLTWPGPRPPYYGLILFLGVTLGLLIIVKIVFLQRSPTQLFGESMMFLYYGYMVPLTRKIAHGFYADGVWSDRGFMPYTDIGAMGWRDGNPATLLIIPRLKQLARPLTVPLSQYGAVRRLLRDKIAANDIQFNGSWLDAGHDGREDV